MPQYFLKRLIATIITMIASTAVVFLMLKMAPGDPATLLLGGHPATSEALSAIRAKYHLDQSLGKQYFLWINNLSHGDFGDSIVGRSTVLAQIQPRLITTLILVSFSSFFMLFFGVILGILAAVRKNSFVDRIITTTMLTFTAVPAYVSGLLLAILFGVYFHLLPTIGDGSEGGITGRLFHSVLPIFALTLTSFAMISRVTRSSMIQQLEVESALGSEMRGLSYRTIVLKYAFRRALIPIVTVSGVQTGYLITSAILIENTFGLNGIGRLLVTSIQQRDFTVVQAITLVLTAIFLLINFIVDIVSVYIDPRLELSKANNQ
jgi:peptide/nickel transport system permease protein